VVTGGLPAGAAGASPPARVRVVSLDLCVADLASAAGRILAWSGERRGRYVCAANVHMVMEAHDAPDFQELVNRADLVVSDGMPLVWAQRLLGHPGAGRIFGPHLAVEVLERAASLGVPVAFYGGTGALLDALRGRLAARWPALRVVAAIAPPFRPPTPEEDEDHVRQLVESGARIVLVGLGCPKQERWMAAHAGRIPAVLMGVGLAFEILAGLRREPPGIMQRTGLGWLYRLAHEPRRLWRRYARHNPRFVLLLLRDWLRHRRAGRSPGTLP
jgi:N-acetylglucosaminyldiphosphoundecaprenol N-acetyl-beta-D-mannosaminyltransferase